MINDSPHCNQSMHEENYYGEHNDIHMTKWYFASQLTVSFYAVEQKVILHFLLEINYF